MTADSYYNLQSYDVKLMFSRNAFLVDIVSERIGQVLKLDSIEGGRLWKGNDILIFNSWHWWPHTGKKQMYIKFHSSHAILTLHASCLMLMPCIFLYFADGISFRKENIYTKT